jgi:short-subunit dehydrogenase
MTEATVAADLDKPLDVEVNLFALVFMTRAVLPHMQSRRSGIIVNMASIGGLIAHSNKVTPYVASKHAVVGFSRGLAKDLAGTGVRVLAVCPHLTDTEFFFHLPRVHRPHKWEQHNPWYDRAIFP